MLQIEDLKIRFKTDDGWFEAVKGVSFNLEKGKSVSIVGESGSGKSVTSLAILRLHDPAAANISGKILLNGTDILQLEESEMQTIRGKQISMIFQEPMTSLNPLLTCGYQVAEVIKKHGLLSGKKATREAVIDLFKEVQLPRPEQIYQSYPHQLSGGQKQRVMIAMALSCNPEILIADEPTTALDVTVQKTIIDLLQKLKAERQMSLIFISHDLGVVSEIADTVLVMYKGELVEQLNNDELFTAPQHPYTKGLLACRPVPQYKLKQLPVIADFVDDINGEIKSSGLTIGEVRSKYSWSREDVDKRKAQLYAQQPLLEVNSLNTWYPISKNWLGKPRNYVRAVDDVSFQVFPGETLGLVGESGCGKTTLGRSILRLIEPTNGTVAFEGTDLLTLNKQDMRAVRKEAQIIFQDPYSSLNPRLTVGQLLMEPLRVHQLYSNDTQRKQKILELLERVSLRPEHFNRYPHEFSGGQRQRIVIARALALQPKFIICDESVSALDVSVQAQVLNLLRELQQELNLTYIFISHDLAVIKHISDRMMVMNQGKIEEMGDPDDIYYHPKKEYTKRLIDSIPGKSMA